jgi:hypothetical protein
MKKLIFTAIMAGISGVVMAQGEKLSNNTTLNGARPALSPVVNNTPYNKAQLESWFSYPQMLTEANIANLASGTVIFMAHDSIAKWVDEGDTLTYNSVYLCAGSVFDPKDNIMDLTTTWPAEKYSKYTNYTLDSIAFAYVYNRYQEEVLDNNSGNMVPVVDTLFVYYYAGQNLSYRGGTVADPSRFSYAAFDQSKRYPQGANRVDTILLTAADSTAARTPSGWVSSYYNHALSAPLAINPNRSGTVQNTVGAFFAFKSGIAYDSTFYYMYEGTGATPPSDKLLNTFALRFNKDANTTPYANLDFYNTTTLTSVRNGYPQAQFLAMQPISLSGYYQEVQFFTRSSTVGLNDIQNDVFAMSNLYPNPAQVNGTAVMAFNLKTAASVNVSIFNITGQLVKSSNNKNFTAGEHAEEINLAGLKAGIYMVNMTVNGTTMTKKLTIVE